MYYMKIVYILKGKKCYILKECHSIIVVWNIVINVTCEKSPISLSMPQDECDKWCGKIDFELIIHVLHILVCCPKGIVVYCVCEVIILSYTNIRKGYNF